MVIVEHFTEGGGWADSCRHELGDTFGHAQLAILEGDTAHYDTGQCAKCGEWVTLDREGPSLLDRLEGVTS